MNMRATHARTLVLVNTATVRERHPQAAAQGRRLMLSQVRFEPKTGSNGARFELPQHTRIGWFGSKGLGVRQGARRPVRTGNWFKR